MGFFNQLNKLNKRVRQKKQARENRKNENVVNKEPTPEELNNNKNGKKAIIYAIIACVLYAVALMIVVNAFKSNIFIGVLSIFLIPLVTIVQKSAVNCAEKQREINGKGFFVLIFAKYLVPLLALGAMLFLIFGVKLFI